LSFLNVPPVEVSEAHWKSLRYFNFYRLVAAFLLYGAAYLHPSSFELVPATDQSLYTWTAFVYCLATACSVLLLAFWRRHFNLQLSGQVLLDVVALTVLMHASGGLRGGLGAMLLVSLAGAGLVGQGRLVLFYAALATLSMLFQQLLLALSSEFDPSAFFQVGLLGAGFFTSAISARLLARRVVANEELARKRGEALANQVCVSQRVIEEMQDGVLLVSPLGEVHLHNPRAEALLGLTAGEAGNLERCSPALEGHFLRWRRREGSKDESGLVFHVPRNGKQLFARFLETPSSAGDTLILLEDMDRLRDVVLGLSEGGKRTISNALLFQACGRTDEKGKSRLLRQVHHMVTRGELTRVGRGELRFDPQASAARHGPLYKKIWRAIRAKAPGFSSQDLALITGAGASHLSKYLRFLEGEGLVRRHGKSGNTLLYAATVAARERRETPYPPLGINDPWETERNASCSLVRLLMERDPADQKAKIVQHCKTILSRFETRHHSNTKEDAS